MVQTVRKDIDVYLRPLIDDLEMFWETRTYVFNVYTLKIIFFLRAILFYTINNFSKYGNLSSYSVKVYYVSPV